jgi:mono/diheme cytochrome c family protein
MTRWTLIGLALLGLGGVTAAGQLALHRARADDSIERGRYLVRIGGCNDCHTSDFMTKNGEIPEDRWLLGNGVGFTGPWGTTYAPNLRRHLLAMTEDDWVHSVRVMETRPPMPWFNLRAMAETDLRAVYRYVRSLPANDVPVPDYVPPDRPPATPHIVMVPRAPDQAAPTTRQ